MKDLGSFGGVETASVNGLNERGQVVGGLFLPGEQQIHPFLWEGEKLVDLITPPFGGSNNSEANWINEAGEVVGNAGLPSLCPGENFQVDHAFLWKKGVMNDLGALRETPVSGGIFINSKSQVVGSSVACDGSKLNAFLWERGSMVDLNTLISDDSTFHLYWAGFIDDQGEIGAFGLLPNGDSHAVFLIPCQEGDKDCVATEQTTAVRTSTLTVAQRLAIRRMTSGSRVRLARRYHIPGLWTPKD